MVEVSGIRGEPGRGDRSSGKHFRSAEFGCFLRVVNVSMSLVESRVWGGQVGIAISARNGQVVTEVVKWVLSFLQ